MFITVLVMLAKPKVNQVARFSMLLLCPPAGGIAASGMPPCSATALAAEPLREIYSPTTTATTAATH